MENQPHGRSGAETVPVSSSSHHHPAFADRFQDFPSGVRKEMISQCKKAMEWRLDALQGEIAGLGIYTFLSKRDKLVGVLDAARRVGLDVGEHELCMATLGTIVERHWKAKQRMCESWLEMERLRQKLSVLEEENKRDREAVSVLPSEFRKTASAPWAAVVSEDEEEEEEAKEGGTVLPTRLKDKLKDQGDLLID